MYNHKITSPILVIFELGVYYKVYFSETYMYVQSFGFI